MKRIISFVLCLSMLVSMLPVSVFAADVDESTPVTEAVLETEAPVITEAPVAETTEAAEPAEETTAAATEAPEETTGEATEPAQTESEATEPEETVAEDTYTEFTWVPDVELPSDEALFAGYVDKVLYGGVSTFGTAAGSKLTGDTKLAYEGFRELILEVAAGERSSAELTVGAGPYADYSVNFSGTTIEARFLSDLFYALLADLPYELYWFDKTLGVSASYGTSGGKLYITLYFTVSPDYSADGAEDTCDLDIAKTGAAASAAANAQAIVDAYADASDYEKLVAYRDEICLLTAYNSSAASNNYNGGYGDPWQLIWVFDGLGSTKVVCEGYAKAFQYLCDLSDFDEDITCYNVQGYMNGGSHMWNVVSINGSSYLVDVTNSEIGTAGGNGGLFLVGRTANAKGNYVFMNQVYTYSSETLALWGSGEGSILTLAEENFDPDSLNVSAPGADATAAMTQEDFTAALADCGGYYALSDTVVISSDMTLPEVRIELRGGTILVEDGATLTNHGGIVLKDGGVLTVNGTLDNSGWYLDVEDGGSLTVNGTLTGNDIGVYGGSLTANGTLDINQVHVGVLNLDNITLTNVPEKKIEYVASPTTTDELIAALALVEQYNPWIGLHEDLTLDKNVTIPAGANVAFENSTLTVASGVTLTLDGEFLVHPNSHLVVAEGGKLVSNVNLNITNHSSHENGAVVTIDGELISNGGIWITDGGALNINGSAVTYGEIHAGFGGNGLTCQVNVSGELTVYGYTNIVPGTSELNIAEGGTVTVGGYLFDDQGNNGFLQAGGAITVDGTLNVIGGLTLGSDAGATLDIGETGEMNIAYDNMWFDVMDTGILTNEGTVTNDCVINDYGTILNYGTFYNNGQIRLFGTGSYDNYGSAHYGNEPVDGARAQLNDFLNDLEDGQGANLYSNITLAEDLTIDLGTDQVVLHSGSELHVPAGVTLTINSSVLVLDGAIVVEEGAVLNISTNVPLEGGEAQMGHLIVNGELNINDGGCLWIDNGGLLEVNGTANVLDDPATEDVGAAIHVGDFSGSGNVNVTGLMSTGGYLNVTPGGWFTLQESGTLNIMNDAEYGCGYLDVTGMAQLYGTVNQDGLMSASNGNGTDEFVPATARIEVYGTLNGSDTSTTFINPNASISVTGTMETAGEVIVEQFGTLWVDGYVTFSGPVTNYGNIHVNFFTSDSGNSAEMTIDGEVTNYGYLAVDPDGTLYVNGTLNISQTMVEEKGFAGYLNSFGYVYVDGTINNYALMDTDSPDGYGFVQINDGGVLNVRDNIVMAVCDKGELIIDGTLNVFTGAYMEVYNAVSGYGRWINIGTVHFGVDYETDTCGCSYFGGYYTQGIDGRLEVELYEGEPLYCDLFYEGEQTLVYAGSDMDSIRTVLGNGLYQNQVTVTEDTTIDQDLTIGTNGSMIIHAGVTIPEGITVTAYGPVIVEELDHDETTADLTVDGILKLYHPSGTLTVNENGTVSVTGTVFNGTSTTVHGDLVIDGSWEGYAPTSTETGTITSSGAQEQLNALLENEEATLTFDVTLTENTVVSGYLAIAEGVSLTVPRGIILTIDGIVDVYGNLNVKSGGVLVNNNILCTNSSGTTCVSGTYGGESNVQTVYENGVLAAVTGIPRDRQWLVVSGILSEEELRAAMDMVADEGYLGGMLFPTADIDLTEDLTVAENVYVIFNGPSDTEGNYDDEYGTYTFTVPEGIAVTGFGGIEIGPNVTLEMNGDLFIYNYLFVAETGCVNLNGWCDTYGRLMVEGTLNQNGGLASTGGQVRLLDGSTLNLGEDAYAWNFMAYGEDGGYFGTYENYPAEKLYLHTYPESAADINTLVAEFQTGKYVDGTVQIDRSSGHGSNFVIDEDVTLVDGTGIMVIDTEGTGPATVTIAEGVTVSISAGASVGIYDTCKVVNNGYLCAEGGTLRVSEGGMLLNNNEVACEGGVITIAENGYSGSGVLCTAWLDGGEISEITGIDRSEQILVAYTCTTQDEIQQVLNLAAEFQWVLVRQHSDLTLDADLDIPENATFRVQRAAVTIPENVTLRNLGVFQVMENSTLVVNGTWLGNVPENYGTIEGNIPMSQDELVAMIEAAGPGGYIELTRNVTITENLTLDNFYLDVAEGVTMYVPAGVTLTWNATEDDYYSVLGVWGNLIVDGTLVNNAELACEYSGTITIAEGSYSGDGIVSNAYWNEAQKGTIIGIPEAQQTLVIIMATSEEAIRDAIAKADTFGSVIILVRQDVTINESLEIPENVTLRLYREIVDGEVIPASMTVSENAYVTVYGTLIVFEHGTLTVNGILIVPGTLTVQDGGMLVNNLEVACDLGTITIADGCYTEGENGAMVMGFEYGRHGVIEGVPQNEQILVGACTSQSEIQQVMDMAGDYRVVLVHLDEDMTIDSDLTIPENVTVWIQRREDEDGTIGKTTIHVTENATVTNNGWFEVREDTCLIVDGNWEGNAPEVFGEIGGDFFVIDQEEFEELLASGDTWISIQGIVELTEQTVIPEGITVELLGTSCMTVPAGIDLIVEGGLILMHDSILTVEGILDNRCYVSVRDWAVLDAEGGEYFQAEGAVLENVHWGDTEGNVTHATILGIHANCQSVIVNGGSEDMVREMIDYATTYGAPYLEINVYEELYLFDNLYLPAITNMTIENWEGGTAELFVPKGVTLINDGRITIRDNGILIVDGRLMGNLPMVDHPNAQFIIAGEISFDQSALEAQLAQSAESGQPVYLSIPLTLTKDLTIPENAGLIITGSGSITVPAGRTLTNNSWIDVIYGGSLTAVNGGAVKNNGSIHAFCEGWVDLSGGVYEHADWASIMLTYSNEGPGTGVGAWIEGIPYEYVTICQEGWDETQLRDIIDLANSLAPIASMLINITGEMTLTEDLTIPEFANVLIENVGYGPAILTVPANRTLTNNGHIQIGHDGHLIVESRGTLEGNQPIVFVGSGEYVNNNFTEADLRAYIDRQVSGNGEVYLSSDITLTADLVIPENVILVISKGGALRVPTGVKLTINGKIKTQMETGLFIQGGTVENNGIIENMHWGVTELISGTYIGDGKLYEVYNSNELGYLYNPDTGKLENTEDAAFVRGFAIEDRTIVARGCDEDNIHMVLDLAQALSDGGSHPNVELWVTDGELFLTRDLTIPYYAQMTVANQRQFDGSVIVPEGITLYNNGYIHIHNDGYMEVQSGAVMDNAADTDIGWAGTLIIREGGVIAGNHPFCYDTGSTYINENTYGQAYLEALIRGAQSAGGSVTLSVPVTLTSDLVIPEGVYLYITGRDNFITIPEGVTLTNNGHIYCHMFGGILGQGGWLHNNGEIRAMNWGAVDMGQSWGNYSSDNGARIHNHHWIYTDGTEGRGTVVGFYPSDVIVHTEGDDDRVIHEMVDFIWHVGDGENGVWSPLDSTVTGDMILNQYLDWPIFGTMIINPGTTLTVPAGVTLDIHGTVIVHGQLIIEEGAVVNTYYPICVDGGEIIGNDETVRYYNPGVALESFTVAVSAEEAAPGQSVNILADRWTPANAEVLAFEYTVLGDNGLFGYDYDGSSMRWIISDPGAPVQLTAEHGGEVTVEVRAIIGVDENGLIYNDQVETVSVTFTGLAIDVLTKDAPDYIENGEHGLWAGGKTILYPALFDTINGTELNAGAVEITYSEGYEQFAKIQEKNGQVTITALNTLTQRETVDITFFTEGAAPTTVTIVLRPKATAANVMLYGENVTNQTILADLNRGDWGFQLDAEGVSSEAAPENATDYNGNSLITWKSSAPAIATVDENGWVSFTGEKTGKVKITMTANYGAKKSAVVTFNVVALPQEIFSSETNPTVLVGGGSGTYTAITGEGAALKSTEVKWYLCDEYGAAAASHPYASITAAGKLTTKAVADETKVYLMAQVIGDEWSATLYEPVCVTLYPAIESIQILDVINDPINDKTLLYDIGIHGLEYQLSWKAMPYAEAVQSVSWKSSKPAVANIDQNGLITVAGENVSGSVKFTLDITAWNGKKTSASFTMKFGIFSTALDLTVTLPDGTVTNDLSQLVVYSGESLTFTGSCVPENVTTDGIIWSLLDKTSGSITNKGVLKTKTVNNPTEIVVVAESKDGYCTYYLPVTVLPKRVSTPIGMLDALIISNDFGYITKTTQTMQSGDAMWLYANGDVTWKSSNSKIATVDADGYLEALQNGTVTITATANDGSKRTATFTLKVSKLSQSVEITTKKGEPFTVASGKSLDLVGTVFYPDGTSDKKVTWSVDNTSIATISSSGKLAAAKGLTKAATVRVHAYAKDGNSSTWEDVLVIPAATAIEVYGPFGVNSRNVDVTNTTVTWDMLNGTNFTLNAAAYPFDAMQDVTWKSSSDKIAYVDPDTGDVECRTSGTVTVTATAKDGSGKKATFKLTVMKSMEDLQLPETAIIGGGKTLTLTKLEGYAIDTLATNQTLNWVMTYPDGSAVPTTVATLTKGILKTKAVTAPVDVYIRAEATDGSGLADDCTVTIYPVTKGIALYGLEKNGALVTVTSKTVKAPINAGYGILTDTTNVAGFDYNDDKTADEYLPNGTAWEISYSKEGLLTAEFDGQAINFYATNAAKVGDSVKITLKAKDGSGKSAYFNLSFTEGTPAAASEITLWTYPIGGWSNPQTVNSLVSAFEAETGIRVKVEYLTYMDGDAIVDNAIATGTTPDLILEGPERLVANWGARGEMVNIADMFDSTDKREIYPNVLNACFADATTAYQYPMTMTAHCIAINKTVFEAAGAMQYIDEETHTWTTEDFLKAVEAVYEYTGYQVGAVFCGGQGGDQGTRALVNNLYGGTYTNPAHTAYTWNTSANIEAMKTLYDCEGIAFDAAIVGGDEIALFYNGILNMAFCWNIAQQQNPNMGNTGAGLTANGDEILVMAFPSENGTDAQLCGGIWGFGIFDNGDQARIEAAKAFIRYFCDSEATADAVRASNYFAVRNTAAGADLSNIWADNAIMAEYNVLMPMLGDYYQVANRWAEARTAWWNMLQAVGISDGSLSAITEIAENYTAMANGR